MRRLFIFCLIVLLLAACLPPSGEPSLSQDSSNEALSWAGALRTLDLADSATPAYDITAVYLRQVGNIFQIRVDLLDFQNENDLSLDIEIGDASSPGIAPFVIHVPSKDHSTRIHLDPLLATVVVEFTLSEIPFHPRINVSTPEDKIFALSPDDPIPTQTAPLLLTFYDAFAGRFPAEALRSWNGAHTGPRGERHGLKHLLDAVEEHQTPIILLDLSKPETLSALDAMNLLPRIKQMQSERLLMLPISTEGQTSFGLQTSPFAYSENVTNPEKIFHSAYVFAFTNDKAHLYRPLFSKTTFLPIATSTESNQPTPKGPALDVRRALLETALNADENDLLVLGGSLRDSTWGSPDMVGSTLAYFASRPYIHILTADDLLNFPARRSRPEFTSPSVDALTHQLETHYAGLTRSVMEFVTNWKGSPLSSCDTDPDTDGLPECVLANENLLAIFDPQGARLTYFFAVERDNVSFSRQQLIGPSWQVVVGLSSPSTWDISAGEAADSGAYPGAFADVDDPFKPYEAVITENRVVFASVDGTRVKTFTLNENSLEVEYQTQESITTQIPLLVEPDTRFTPGWAKKYEQENTPGGIAWGLENGPKIELQAEGPITMRTFNEALFLLGNPEDPDFDYPPGHYVPFPMAIAEVEMRDGYFLRLERRP